MQLYHDYLESPLGLIAVSATAQGITEVAFCQQEALPPEPNRWTDDAKQQLAAYFAKALTQFDLPLAAKGTVFQQQVWQALMAIPFGQTTSYGYIAKHLANPKAMRAVGMANSKNPIAIIVPCHRVIGANGTLTGYAGGLEKKAWLLAHEGWQQ